LEFDEEGLRRCGGADVPDKKQREESEAGE